MESSAPQAITLTEAAASRVREFLAEEGGVGLRIGLRRTGCSGWAYEVDLAKTVEDNDLVLEDRGVQIVVARDKLTYLAGTRVDFAADGLSRSFRFLNPNAGEECGCGESFTLTLDPAQAAS